MGAIANESLDSYFSNDAGTKWFAGSFVLRMRCYASGWMALALPVYANVSWDPEKPWNKPVHTGRASATQP